MKKFFITFIGCLSFLLGTPSDIKAQELPIIEFFHGAECPHCHKEKTWFPTLKQMYPDIVIKEYEVWHEAENKKKLETKLQALNAKFQGVPTNIIKDEIVVGFNKAGILALLEKNYGPPAITEDQITPPAKNNQTLWFIIGAILLLFVILFVGAKNKK